MDVQLDDRTAAFGAAVMRMMAAAGADARAADDPLATARLMVREGARLIPGAQCALCHVERDTHFHVVAASGGLRDHVEGIKGRVLGTHLHQAVEGLLPIVVTPDATVDALLAPAMARAGVRRARLSPLLSRGMLSVKVVGVCIFTRTDDAGFSPEEGQLLDTYASLVAMSLVRTVQRDEADRRSRRLELGVDLALDLAEVPSPADVNRRVLARVLQVLDADRATLLRLEGRDVVAEATQDVSRRSLVSGFSFHLDAQPAMLTAFQQRHSFSSGHLVTDALPSAVREALSDVQHLVVLPLVLGEEVIGFLNVGRRRDEPFDERDEETLELIGSVAAVTLRNARLLADTTSARHTMSEFLHVVMHELRGPLTIIGGYLSMIQEGIFGSPPPAWSRALDTMDVKVREAQRLVDELLLAARLEGGNLPVREEEVDLGDAVRHALTRAQPRAQLLHAGLDARTPEGVLVCADRLHVDRILDNLINNALTHGGKPPQAFVEVVGGDEPSVGITDNGAGVAEQDRPHIFERFYRGGSSGAGTGLGLYISRQLAERSHGSLDLNPPREGSRGAHFTLRLQAAGSRETAC